MQTIIDLSVLTPSQGFIIQSRQVGNEAGSSVSQAGDINGDGLDDLVVGAFRNGDGGIYAGAAYVIFGKAEMSRVINDLTGLAASDGFIIQGDVARDRAGSSVSSAGDINGDGIDDLIIGAPGGDDGGDYAGEAYVIFGKAGATRAGIDLSVLAANDGFIIQGDEDIDQAGSSVSSAGDINGDGLDDLIIGAPGGDDGGNYAGEAYVIFGKAGATRTNIDLSVLAANDGFIIQGDEVNDRAGFSVSSAGDVNGDNVEDLIVGAAAGSDGGNFAGEAYVIFGKAGATRANIDLTTLADSDGFIIQGDAGSDGAGRSVSSAGDINGDGFDDLIVGAPFGDDGDANAGESYVIFGKAGATRANIDLTTLADSDGFIIQGDAAGDEAGSSVSSAGDINGDGFDDLIVGAPNGDDGGIDAGEAYVIFGKAGATRANIDLTTLADSDGFIIQGDAAGDEAGSSVSSAGDINGDGFVDLIVGAPGSDDGGFNSGAAYVILGGSNSSPEVTPETQTLTSLPDTMLTVLVDATDPDGDPLTYNSSTAGHGTLTGGESGSFFYTPDPAYLGPDSFTVTVDDGNGGMATQTINLSIVELPDADDFSMFASDGFVGAVGGSGNVFGTSALQDIAILDEAGTIAFDPSFNRGGDIIRLPGDGSDWHVVRSGSSALFSDGDSFVQVPVGTAGTAIVFDDGARTLKFETSSGSFTIGEQAFAGALEPITAAPDGTNLPGGGDSAASAILFLAAGEGVSAGGRIDIFGTSSPEPVRLLSGDITLDPSFNRGGDTISFDQPATDFLASRSGSSVFLDSDTTDALIPVGTAGTTLSFVAADARTLLFDTGQGAFTIDTQQIGFDPVALAAAV